MMDKLKELLNKDKKMSNLVLIAILLIIVLISTGYIWGDEEKQVSSNNVLSNNGNNIQFNDGYDLEKKLSNIISKIEGVESAEVMISYSTTERIIPVYDVKEDINTVKENVKESTKTTTEKTVAYESKDGSKIAIVQSKETAAAVGAIVVVSGEVSDDVSEDIKEAISFATSVPIHKIQIFIN
ncbi:MAG: hypothetical protein IKL08_07040 [Clostridia bacterium]|nr:hypothetical protein [Clostridia bacterium]